jgi:hypothetical protein
MTRLPATSETAGGSAWTVLRAACVQAFAGVRPSATQGRRHIRHSAAAAQGRAGGEAGQQRQVEGRAGRAARVPDLPRGPGRHRRRRPAALPLTRALRCCRRCGACYWRLCRCVIVRGTACSPPHAGEQAVCGAVLPLPDPASCCGKLARVRAPVAAKAARRRGVPHACVQLTYQARVRCPLPSARPAHHATSQAAPCMAWHPHGAPATRTAHLKMSAAMRPALQRCLNCALA